MDSTTYSQIEASLLAHFEDSKVDEILCNGASHAFVVRGVFSTALPSPFQSPEAMFHWLVHFSRSLGVRLDPLCGSAGGQWHRGQYRWHCVLPPLAQDGPVFSLRKHRFDSLTLGDFDISQDLLAELSQAMTERRHLLIVGPTGSGKTSLLATLLATFAATDRVVVVESLAELPCLSPLWLRLLERRPNLEQVGAVSMQRLIHEALRLRPDRLVIGEIRGDEAKAYQEAIMTGHSGSMATLHAENAAQAVRRLQTLTGHDRREAVDETGTSLSIAVMARANPPRLLSLVTVALLT